MGTCVVFWKTNPNLSPEAIAKAAASIMQKGIYPGKGCEILAWYMCPGGKGVSILEYKDAGPNAEFENWLTWVKELPGIFVEYEAMPAVSALEAVQMVLSKKK